MKNINQKSKHSIFTTITNATKAPFCTNVSSLSNHYTQSWMVTSDWWIFFKNDKWSSETLKAFFQKAEMQFIQIFIMIKCLEFKDVT